MQIGSTETKSLADRGPEQTTDNTEKLKVAYRPDDIMLTVAYSPGKPEMMRLQGVYSSQELLHV